MAVAVTAVEVVAAGDPGAAAVDGAPVPAIVASGGEEVGRGWVRVDADRGGGPPAATTWAPRLRPGLDRDTRVAALDGFVRWVLGVAADRGVVTVETKPADDVADLADWLAVLRRHGFGEVAVAHLLTRPLPLDEPARPAPAGLTLVEVDRLDPGARAALASVVEAVHRSTDDRVDALDDRPGEDVLAGLAGNRVAAPAPGLWLAAVGDDGPVGYVLGSVDDEDVWVMDVGVEPAARRRGLGRWLLTSMLAAAGPARRACALVDDVNLPSRRLHLGAGFAEEPGSYRTWRLTRLTR